jgi:hypothetical protein
MAELKVASLYADIGAKTQGFEKGATSVLGGLGKVALSVGAVTSALAIMEQAWDMSKEGAELMRLADSGAEMARQFGGNMDTIVEKVKAASLGTVSEMDIIASSNKAMMLGLGADADQLANLMEVAAFRGRAMGISTTQAFDDIVRGVGRASPMILDNLGIVVNAKETYDAYAKEIGKSANELTKSEKTQALLNAVLKEGNTMLDKAGGLVEDNASQYERLTARTTDYKNELKQTLTEAVTPSLKAFLDYADAMDKASEATGLTDQRSRIYLGAMQLQVDKQKEQEESTKNTTTAIAEQGDAMQENIPTLEELNQAMEDLQEANANLIDGAIEITNRNKDYQQSQEDILAQISELTTEKENMYSWEVDKIQETQDKIDELSEQYAQNAEDFRAAMEEKFSLMAVEQIALSDGIEGFSQAEYEKARLILETQDIATAAAFEEQQAMTMLAEAVANGTLPVEQWGATLDSVMADGVVSVAEVQAAIEAVPKQNTVTFDIVTNGAPPNLDLSPDASTAPKGTHRTGHANGGSFLVPQSYGIEGFVMGNGDTASGGELITVSSGSGSQTDTRMLELLERIANKPSFTEYELARVVSDAVIQVSQ